MTAAETPRWMELFQQALDSAEGSRQIVADQMGVSRTLVSLVASDNYHARLDKFAKKVLDAFDGFECPHLGSRVTTNACRANAVRQAPTSSAREARHWRACQSCPHKPTEEQTP